MPSRYVRIHMKPLRRLSIDLYLCPHSTHPMRTSILSRCSTGNTAKLLPLIALYAICPQLTSLNPNIIKGDRCHCSDGSRSIPADTPVQEFAIPPSTPMMTTTLNQPFQLFKTLRANLAIPVLRSQDAPEPSDRPIRHNPQNLSQSPLHPSKPKQEVTLQHDHP